MLSDERRAILLEQVAFYARLGPEERARFERQVVAFIERKVIVTRGVELDDRVKLIVAAHACRLTLNLVAEEYSKLQYVHVVDSHHNDDGEPLLGSASDNSSVTLEWSALVDGARDDGDGENVGYHEFAHVLDASDGVSDGVPPLLLDPTQRGKWQRVLAAELEQVAWRRRAGYSNRTRRGCHEERGRALRRGHRSVLRKTGTSEERAPRAVHAALRVLPPASRPACRLDSGVETIVSHGVSDHGEAMQDHRSPQARG